MLTIRFFCETINLFGKRVSFNEKKRNPMNEFRFEGYF
jgi:hypothetical protein